MAVFALVTGVNHRVAAYGYRGGSLFERREFSMAGTLVKHPQGDLLIDAGFGRNIAEQFQTMPLMFRAITFYSLWQPAADQLRAAGNRYVPFFSPIRIGTTSAACPTLTIST
jgi:N-acyl homoserine lactone hydrolase